MRATHITFIGLVAVVVAVAAHAQQQAPVNPSAAPSQMAMDCAKAPKHHDHGMEKGMGPSRRSPCAQAAAASAPKATKAHGPRQAP